MHRTKVRVVEDALDANNTIARANRDDFDRAGVAVVNLMSAPGAGKTTLLERALDDLRAACAPACSRATCRAASTPTGSRSLHVPVVAAQHRTRASAASATSTRTWSARRSPALPLDELDLLVIENVGNLVCPAEFRVGEDARIMVCSVTEGEDKPLKYPLMFRACELVLINKIDLLAAPRLRPRPAPAPTSTRSTRACERMLVSARTGEGVDAFRDWLARVPARARRRGVSDRRATASTTLRERAEANERFFAAEAERIARLCHRMAERFARGGRLIALGATPAARSDARHVAVEFVHPVIVGKRALPALGLARRGRAARRAGRR